MTVATSWALMWVVHEEAEVEFGDRYLDMFAPVSPCTETQLVR